MNQASIGITRILKVDQDGDVWFRSGRGLGHFDPLFLEVDIYPGASNFIALEFLSASAWAILEMNANRSFPRKILRGTFVFPSLATEREIRLDDIPYTELPEVNTQTRSEIIISNTGEGGLKVRDITIDSEMFRFQAEQYTRRGAWFESTSGVIPRNDSLRIELVYFPTEPGEHEGIFTIESNDPENPIFQIALSGATLGSVGPHINLEPELNFESTLTFETQSKTLTIRNNGTGLLSIDSITTDIDVFRVSGDSLLIPPGESEEIEVIFAPDTGGEHTGILTIQSDDPANPSAEVILIGTGVELPEGPITMDFHLAEGDQEERIAGGASPGSKYYLQLYVNGAPEISGWSAKTEYDPEQLRYESFQKGNFLPDLFTLPLAGEGSIEVGGALLDSDASNSGDGSLGIISFEVLEGFTGNTNLIITDISFHLTNGVDELLTVRSVATITIEPVAGILSGDFDGNGAVNFTDFFLFADNFGQAIPPANPMFDLDRNGSVGFPDFFQFADNFGTEARAKLIALAHEFIGLPLSPRLEQNYPNPFNNSTFIRFEVAQTNWVRLDIFDLTGQKVKTLVNDTRKQGLYELPWDGTNERGIAISTGMYFARLQSGDFTGVKKMMLVK